MEQLLTQTKKTINTSEINAGDVFSEESHYVFLGLENGKHKFKHLESNQIVYLDTKYVSDLLQTADQYDEEIEVGVEDKFWTAKQIEEGKKKGTIEADSPLRDGDLKLKGIRSIWSDIHTTQVWSVCFNKKGKELTKKALTAAKEKQIQEALEAIVAKKQTLEEAFKSIQENPIFPVEAGDERILRGYKVQFVSNNGSYDVVDMDQDDNGKGSNLRKVNINEINWLVINGIKYVVA